MFMNILVEAALSGGGFSDVLSRCGLCFCEHSILPRAYDVVFSEPSFGRYEQRPRF